MTSVIGASSINQSILLLSADSASIWLNDALNSIQNQGNAAGLLGMLQNSGGNGSISSFLGASANNANTFALISQNSVTNTSSLVAQIAAQNAQQQNAQKLQDLSMRFPQPNKWFNRKTCSTLLCFSRMDRRLIRTATS